jgi:hypothetical protein
MVIILFPSSGQTYIEQSSSPTQTEKPKQMQITVGNNKSRIDNTEKIMDVAPQVILNRTMVPLRFIGEFLGADFDWNQTIKTVTIKCNGKEIRLVVDTQPGMDVPPTLINGRTMVPISYISETFGAEVKWDDSTQTVDITK